MPDPFKIIDLAEKLGVFRKIKDKLLRQPDAADEKLVTVLAEISKIYLAIDSELVKYLSLSFYSAADTPNERKILLTLEGGQVMARIEEGRAHCHKIGNIYRQYLDPWLRKLLTPLEFTETQDLFQRLSEADFAMIEDMQQVGAWLSAAASKTLTLVDANRLDEANGIIKAARLEILPTRQAIGTALSTLRSLQGEFIQKSGVT